MLQTSEQKDSVQLDDSLPHSATWDGTDVFPLDNLDFRIEGGESSLWLPTPTASDARRWKYSIKNLAKSYWRKQKCKLYQATNLPEYLAANFGVKFTPGLYELIMGFPILWSASAD